MNIHLRPPIPATRRGLKLLVLAVMIGIKGAGYAVGKTSNSTESSLRLITERLDIPLSAFGFLMLALCVFAAVTAFSRHGRDVWGYMALVGFCVGWSATFAVGVLFFGAPGFAWQGAINALIFAGFLLLCASDPDSGDGE
jgi:hypothetical protein